MPKHRTPYHFSATRRDQPSGLGPRAAHPRPELAASLGPHPLFPEALLQKLLQQAG
jgi:hypothetical protein